VCHSGEEDRDVSHRRLLRVRRPVGRRDRGRHQTAGPPRPAGRGRTPCTRLGRVVEDALLLGGPGAGPGLRRPPQGECVDDDPGGRARWSHRGHRHRRAGQRRHGGSSLPRRRRGRRPRSRQPAPRAPGRIRTVQRSPPPHGRGADGEPADAASVHRRGFRRGAPDRGRRDAARPGSARDRRVPHRCGRSRGPERGAVPRTAAAPCVGRRRRRPAGRHRRRRRGRALDPSRRLPRPDRGAAPLRAHHRRGPCRLVPGGGR
jgi:hypothetical protein